MKIRQRINGGWCMEHKGTEAPYDVVPTPDGRFSVFDLDDEDHERPIAEASDRLTAEALTLAHFTAFVRP